MAAGFGKANDLFVAAVEAIYGAAAQPSNWARALEAVADVFGDVGANLIWRRDDGSLGIIVSPSLLFCAEEWNKWQDADIRAQRVHDRSIAAQFDAVTDRHLVTAQEVEAHPFYTQFLIPNGLGWLASAPVSPDPAVVVWISVQRAKAKASFSDEELEILARLARHAEQSLRLSVRLFDAELSKVGMGEALARLGIGVFALDSLKRVVFANPAAERVVGKGLDIANGRLCAAAKHETTALKCEIDRVIHATPEQVDGAPKPVLIHREEHDRPLALYVLPVTAHGLDPAAAQFLTHARAIVLVIDPQADSPADPAVVRDILGLTLGEARVAALVGFGLTPRAAAEQLGIAEETARVVLKRVFAKAGVSRQSELSALLTKLVLR
ncbi:helix-turn-helix transcriptional regulator [Methylocystis heyeri]|uniref:Helix-turn-helix transcriptional regulator n=1 Tax=Methylocystis heyeri TaxID=391905 RepID=A0A6B8KC58_9HYPH|nr:helix-turn-helix transcriptional regulator [Methylocystis heyeri]QGM44615.1 helix-turn-helix transcriptional regulator [Methylocystis heyeri]